jgi:archaemetzincin
MKRMSVVLLLFICMVSHLQIIDSNSVYSLQTVKEKKAIALQPFEKIDTTLLISLKGNLQDSLNCQLVLLNQIQLPINAWFAPRERYIADSLLVFLRQQKGSRFTKILGVTNKDISTCKEGNANWGVMGLGYCPGASCVISTYRVKGSSKSIDHFRDRITRLALHELGHTFGAPHCKERDCIMRDAEGKMNLDKARVYCNDCRTKIMGKM